MQSPSTKIGKTGSNGRLRAAVPNGKKLVIKPLKTKPQLPASFEADTLAKLLEAVHAVQNKRAVACSLEELYRAVEDMCLHKMAARLYGNLQQVCDTHVGRTLDALAADAAVDAVRFLLQAVAVWNDHCEQMLMLRSIFLYLDRTFVISTSGVHSLFEMGLQLFRAHMSRHPEVMDFYLTGHRLEVQVERKTVVGLLQLIASERSGDSVDRALLHTLLRMLTSLGIYGQAFEEPFLEDTATFYDTEGVVQLQSLDVPDYLAHCERRLGEEYERCTLYLAPETRKPLIASVESQLLERHVAAILEKGFDTLMNEQRVADLGRLYALFSRVRALESLKVAFREYIKKTGLVLIMDEEKDKDMVELLLKMKAGLDNILAAAFQKNEAYANSLKEAFEQFINRRANKPAELIAKFLDGVLRAGNKGQSEEDLEGTLDNALLLFRYISGKDVFEAFYKKDLAKRLLLAKSASVDAEKAMITKLKAECGSQFTNKLEGMFKDIDLSHDIMASFKQSISRPKDPRIIQAVVRARIAAGIDMNVNVLTSGYWPSYPIIEARLPEELATYQQVFKDFYLSKHSGRRLVWHNSLGSCVLRAQFAKAPKELSVSLFQTVVLMLFNDEDCLGLEDIRTTSGLEDKELRRTLQSLACGKLRVLTKEPKGREVENGDVFRFNDAFSAALYRIKINSIQLKETQEENKKTNEQVIQDRQYQIDAAIVRVMKTRKTLSHKLLISELMTQLKFPMKASDLKKRIESLIEREYMERDAGNHQVYNYLA